MPSPKSVQWGSCVALGCCAECACTADMMRSSDTFPSSAGSTLIALVAVEATAWSFCHSGWQDRGDRVYSEAGQGRKASPTCLEDLVRAVCRCEVARLNSFFARQAIGTLGNMSVGNQATEAILQFSKQAKKDQEFLRFFTESFSCQHQYFSGMTQGELAQLAHCYEDQLQDPDVAGVLKTFLLIGDRREGGEAATEVKPRLFKRILVLAERKDDGKYKVLIASATQRRAVNWRAVGISSGAVVGLGAGSAGVAWLLGATNPLLVGAVVGSMTMIAAGAKATMDYFDEAGNVVLGCLLDRMESEKCITIEGTTLKLL